jgi:hypothetical protein
MSYSKLMEQMLIVENYPSEDNLKNLKQMILKYQIETENKTMNKKLGTDKIANLINKYLKIQEDIRPQLAKMLVTDEGKYICDGYTLFKFNSSLEFVGIPSVYDKKEYIDIKNLLDIKNSTIENFKIDLDLLKEKLILYKINKKKPNKENGYIIKDRYFNPTFIENAVKIIGNIKEIEYDNKHKASPIKLYGDNGVVLILPYLPK